MAFESNFVTFIGNLTEDPDVRFTGGGTPVVGLRVASNRRWTGKDGQQQEETTFLNVNCWRELADNVGATLNKGDRVIVIGRLRVRSYENKDGQTVWVTEIEADEVAPSLRWAQASISRTSGGGGGGGSQGGRPSGSNDFAQPAPPDDDVPF